jgi:MFS family permease
MGKYRLSGSLGWAFSCIATGLLVGGNIWSIFPITLSLSSLSLLASLAIPEVEEERKACNKSTEYRMRVSLKIIVPFILSIFLSSIGMSAASSFLNILLFQLGSDPFFIGTTIAIGALLEVPAMYWGGRFSDKIGDIPVLILGEAGLGMVYWLYGTVKNFYTYLIIQGIRGILYALFTVSGMSLSSSIGRGGRGGLYAGLYNLSLQFGMSSGPFFGGLASDTFGITAMFLMASAFSELSAVLLVPLVVRGREGREYCRR